MGKEANFTVCMWYFRIYPTDIKTTKADLSCDPKLWVDNLILSFDYKQQYEYLPLKYAMRKKWLDEINDCDTYTNGVYTKYALNCNDTWS